MDTTRVRIHKISVAHAGGTILQTHSGEAQTRDRLDIARAAVGSRRYTIRQVVLPEISFASPLAIDHTNLLFQCHLGDHRFSLRVRFSPVTRPLSGSYDVLGIHPEQQ